MSTDLAPTEPLQSRPSPWRSGIARDCALAVAVAAVTVWCFWPLLSQPLQSDDFGLIAQNRDLGIGGALRFLLTADYGEQQWAYWRPAWFFTFWLLHAGFGTEPAPYQVVSLTLHVAYVLTLFAATRAVTGSGLVATGAALLFALHPAHDEAVMWVAASTNVVPAALLLLLATWSLASFDGSTKRLVVAVSLATASLAWKEAAYGFPLVILAAWACSRRSGAHGAIDRRFALAFAAFTAVVMLHYVFRNRSAGLAGSPSDILHVFAASIAGFVRRVTTLGGGDVPLALGLAVLAAVAALLLPRQGRFWLAATIAGTLPYAFLTAGARFGYFIDGPLCVLLAIALAHTIGGGRSAWRGALAATMLLVPLWLAPTTLSAALARFGSDAEQANRIVDNLIRDGHADRDTLWVDVVPLSLMNGLEQALELRTGRDLTIRSLQATPRPPFLVHIDVNTAPPPRDATILRLDREHDRYVAMSLDTMLGGLAPVPIFALCSRFRRVADAAEAQALLASRACDPAVEPLLQAEPTAALDPAARGEIRAIRTDIRDMGAAVECSGPMLLVVSFPVAVDFVNPPGAILLDGAPVPVLAANLLFHAIVVPAGTHDVRLVPKF